MLETRKEAFPETLSFLAQRPRARSWLGAPIGAAAHGVVLVGLVLASLYSGGENVPPPQSPIVFRFAPPPPPPVRRGKMGTSEERPTPVEPTTERQRSRRLAFPEDYRLPDEILAPAFDLPLGFEGGFDDGELYGMESGIAGGVLGGVPGGLVGGVVGGTGTKLPRFPKPDVGPNPLRMPLPSYTKEAIRDKVAGAVVLRVIIDEQGKVQVLEVIRSIPELDGEAIRVVESSWRFAPATRNGRPVAALSDLVVRFNLY